MENKRKIPKRIFSFFLAILCTFGILFVSYIDIFADESFYVKYDTSDTLLSASFFVKDLTSNSSFTITLDTSTKEAFGGNFVAGHYYEVRARFQNDNYTYKYANVITFKHLIPNGTQSIPLKGYSTSQTDPDYTRISSFNSNDYFYCYNFYSSSSYNRYFYFTLVDNSTSTPDPTPNYTPTPAPATPTPNPYGPGPVPTFPPGEQSYTDFFSRLASDAQSAFNAIFLSWNNANSRFYSGIFFIGFPILLGIIGLVASIFFGDDD